MITSPFNTQPSEKVIVEAHPVLRVGYRMKFDYRLIVFHE